MSCHHPDQSLSSLRALLERRRQQFETLTNEADNVSADEIAAAQIARRTLCTVILDIDRLIAAAQPLTEAA